MKQGLRPVGFDREFHKLSRNIKFIKFGLVDIFLFNFEVGSSIEFKLIELIQIWISGLAQETKRAGPATLWRAAGRLTGGSRMSASVKTRIGMSERGP